MAEGTAHDQPELRRIAKALAASRERLAHAVLDALVAEVDEYAALPPEELHGDIIGLTRTNIGRFVEALAEGRPLSEEAIQEIRDSAARRADEGVPLEALLRGYALSVRVVVEDLSAGADLDHLHAVAVHALDYLGVATAAAAAGYLDEHQMIQGAAQQQEERILDALLTGRALAGPDQARMPCPTVDVVRFAIAPHADETEPGVDARIAARRKLRRFHAELRRRAPHALASLAGDGGIAIVPLEFDGGCTTELVDGLMTASGAAVTAAADLTEVPHIPGAVTTAGEVLDLVQQLGHGPGLYRLDDVVPAYQLTRPGPARDALVRILEPLHGHDELRPTLRRYLETGRNRRHTALDLGVHVNTVDYRIAKVARLTGLDPLDPADGHRLHAASIAAPD